MESICSLDDLTMDDVKFLKIAVEYTIEHSDSKELAETPLCKLLERLNDLEKEINV